MFQSLTKGGKVTGSPTAMTRFVGDPQAHPDAFKCSDGRRAFNNSIAALVYGYAHAAHDNGQEGLYLLPSTYRTAIREIQDSINAAEWRLRNTCGHYLERVPGGSKKKKKRRIVMMENYFVDWRTARISLEQLLSDIEALPPEECQVRMRALFENFVKPTAALFGHLPADRLGAPDWRAVSEGGELKKASSEQILIRVEQACERGQFHTGPLTDYPSADISGQLGNTHVQARAELTPDEVTRADGSGREVMERLAERLRDPNLGLGIKTQRALQSLVIFYLDRLQQDNSVNVSISELAGYMGYQKGPNGYHPDAYPSVRDAVRPLESLTVQMVNLPALKGRALPTNVQEKAFTFTYFADDDGSNIRPAARWHTISFRPNRYYTAILTAPDSRLMGADKSINRLNPRNERAESLLGKYLERHWRMNWNNTHGSITRSVLHLLTDGMGLTDEDANKPSVETWRKIEDALDKLQEDIGVVRHWEGDAAWAEVRELLQPDNGTPRRMTQSLWHRLLGAMVTIEAGGQYLEYYKNHSLVYKGGDFDRLILELREYRARSNRPDARIAEDLGIRKALLLQILKGSKKIGEPLRARIERLIASSKNAAAALHLDCRHSEVETIDRRVPFRGN